MTYLWCGLATGSIFLALAMQGEGDMRWPLPGLVVFTFVYALLWPVFWLGLLWGVAEEFS